MKASNIFIGLFIFCSLFQPSDEASMGVFLTWAFVLVALAAWAYMCRKWEAEEDNKHGKC